MSRTGPSRPISAENSRATNTPEPRQILKASSVETTRVFAPNASIVLVGIRGCGKTSLGYIAARALGRRLIEADDEFERKTGCSRAQFLKDHRNDAEAYRLQERQVMESMLANNERDAVIVCGVGSIESHGQMLLRKYALSHPVIHVVRETEYVREWLRIPKDSNLMQRLEDSDRKHRICSNFEFYNVFDGGLERGRADGRISRDEVPGQRSPRYNGTLLRTQEDFIRFVNFAMGFTNPPLQGLYSKISAAASSPEDRVYTYALSVEFSKIANGGIDITELECGVDVVELEINASDIVGQSIAVDSTWVTKLSEQFAILRRKVAAPIIFHVNTRSFDLFNDSRVSKEEAYLELLHLGVRMGAEFVTVDIEIDEGSAREFLRGRGSTKIIGDSFEYQPSSEGWDDLERFSKYQKAAKLPCDIIRMRQFASSDDDNVAIRSFIRKINSQSGVRPPLIAYNLGRLGRASMCSNTILTAVTHPVLRPRKAADHAALLTMQEASKMTYDLGLLDPMHFCVFGASVLYSISPAMHNAAYRACGLPHEYTIHQSSTIRDFETLLKDPSFGGSAISHPYKTEVLKGLTSLSPEAQAIGAVNTTIPVRSTKDDSRLIQKSRAGEIIGCHGDNTDWIGISTCIRRNLSPANLIRPWTSGLVVGAGGMARASIYAMIRLDVPNIFICNRTVANAEKLAAHFTEIASKFRNSARSANARNVKHRFIVLKSMQDPWPPEYEQPTMVVSCVPALSVGDSPAANLTLPVPWLQSVNGGVIVEASETSFMLAQVTNISTSLPINHSSLPY